MPANPLLAAYKLLRELEEVDHEFIASDCEEACNCILRVLHETDRQAYLDCVAWDVDRSLPQGVTCDAR